MASRIWRAVPAVTCIVLVAALVLAGSDSQTAICVDCSPLTRIIHRIVSLLLAILLLIIGLSVFIRK